MSFRTQKTKLKPVTGKQDINIAKPAVKKQDNELLKQKVKQNLFREKTYCQKKKRGVDGDIKERSKLSLASSDLPSLDGSPTSIKSAAPPNARSESDSSDFSNLPKNFFRTQTTKLQETRKQDRQMRKQDVGGDIFVKQNVPEKKLKFQSDMQRTESRKQADRGRVLPRSESSKVVDIKNRFESPRENFDAAQDNFEKNHIDGFLIADEQRRILINEKPVLDKIPIGRKENTYFLIEKSKRVTTRRTYVDDCGAWHSDTSSRKSYYLVVDIKLRFMSKVNKQFGAKSRKSFVPLNPQPEINDVITATRYYSKLKRDINYQRRITRFDKLRPGMPDNELCMLVEYIGKYPTINFAHGNAKNSKGDYMRTSDNINSEIIDKIIAHQMPRQVYTDMVLNDSDNAPRDLRQVQNVKSNVERKKTGTLITVK